MVKEIMDKLKHAQGEGSKLEQQTDVLLQQIDNGLSTAPATLPTMVKNMQSKSKASEKRVEKSEKAYEKSAKTTFKAYGKSLKGQEKSAEKDANKEEKSVENRE